jgi:hypothetical protein
MIDYQTFCAIQDHHRERGLNATQIAEALQLDARTVAKWLDEERFRPRRPQRRASKLDPHKATIRRWLEAHRYSAQQVFQRLREEEDDQGWISIVKDYVRQIRPPRTPAFLTLSFAPGECAQVDWGGVGGGPGRGDPPALVAVRDGAVLQPDALCGVHPEPDHGAVPGLSSERLWVRLF